MQKNEQIQKTRICRGCGKPLRQKYYQYCIYCRKIKKKQKLITREIRQAIKMAMKT